MRGMGKKRNRKNWSDDENAIMFEHYGSMEIRALMDLLGRTKPQIYNQAKKLGITGDKPPPFTDEEKEKIRQLNGAGYMDVDIAAILNRSLPTVHKYRKELGLPVVERSEETIERWREAKKRYYQSEKYQEHLQRKFAGHRALAEDYNLPSDLKYKQVMIIVMLAFHGMMTRNQIAEKLDIVLESTSSRYIPDLLNRGLLTYIPNAQNGQRRGWYMLSPLAMDLLTLGQKPADATA